MRSFSFGFGAPLAFAFTLYSMPAPAAPAASAAPTAAAVVKTYADIGQAMYEDALGGAHALQTAVAAFIAHPNTQTLDAARQAWKAARRPYLQSEGFRFGNPIVDEWEPRVNSWPLDEGLIDYVAPAYGATSDKNPLYAANVIANTRIRIGAKEIDASRIDKALLRQLQEAAGVESNVATGYHAIEFLLWGQDLNGTGPGAGERPYTDYDAARCTHGNCGRRAAYLKAVTDLLVEDMAGMATAWAPGGKARKVLLAKTPEQGLAVILTGLGSLSYGELAGERMKLGLALHDPEEEQDCFSDNTARAHFDTIMGMAAIWQARYKRTNGSIVSGPSPLDYTRAVAPSAERQLNLAMAETVRRATVMMLTAASGRMAYDQMIGSGNTAGNKIVQDVIDALVAQKRAIDGVTAGLKLDVRIENGGDFDNAGRS